MSGGTPLIEGNEREIEAMDDPHILEADELLTLEARARAVRLVDEALAD